MWSVIQNVPQVSVHCCRCWSPLAIRTHQLNALGGQRCSSSISSGISTSSASTIAPSTTLKCRRRRLRAEGKREILEQRAAQACGRAGPTSPAGALWTRSDSATLTETSGVATFVSVRGAGRRRGPTSRAGIHAQRAHRIVTPPSLRKTRFAAASVAPGECIVNVWVCAH